MRLLYWVDLGAAHFRFWVLMDPKLLKNPISSEAPYLVLAEI